MNAKQVKLSTRLRNAREGQGQVLLGSGRGDHVEGHLLDDVARPTSGVPIDTTGGPDGPRSPGNGTGPADSQPCGSRRVRHGVLHRSAAGAWRQRNPSSSGACLVAQAARFARVHPQQRQDRGRGPEQQIDGEFTLLSGSRVVAAWHGVSKGASTQAFESHRAQHESLLEDGSITVEGGIGHVTRDIVISSPSTAGAVAMGRSCNGRVQWVSLKGSCGAGESRGID